MRQVGLSRSRLVSDQEEGYPLPGKSVKRLGLAASTGTDQ